jgi:hypothetical protein
MATQKRPSARAPAIGAEWLLDAASARLASNKGARCPLRAALASLAEDARARLMATTNLRGAALDAAQCQAVALARSTPEIICTLAMCDLCVAWSRTLLANVRSRIAAGHAPIDFFVLTSSFARASMAFKKSDDPVPTYRVHFDTVPARDADSCRRDHRGDRDGNNDDDHDRNGNNDGDARADESGNNDDHPKGQPNPSSVRHREFYFANEATFIAYRYFLRHAWESLDGVPAEWRRPLPADMCGWLDSAMRMRDLALTLPQYRLCMPCHPTATAALGRSQSALWQRSTSVSRPCFNAQTDSDMRCMAQERPRQKQQERQPSPLTTGVVVMASSSLCPSTIAQSTGPNETKGHDCQQQQGHSQNN